MHDIISGSALLIDVNGPPKKESSPLLNCAKIGQSYFVGAINNRALHGVCATSPFLSQASSSPLRRQRANESSTRARQAQLDELIGGGREGNSPSPFYTRPSPERKEWNCLLRKDARWRLCTPPTPLRAGHTEVRGPQSHLV